MKRHPSHCYLCGSPLVKPTNVDHVPPKQLFAPAVRRRHNPKLLTIPVHASCNKSYQDDEDYFVHAIMPFARGSEAGNAIYKHVLNSYRGGHNSRLVMKVLREFQPRPSGLILPGNAVVKRFEGHRISRVAWKIVRGLYFHHHEIVLPADLTTSVTLTPPDQKPPEHFLAFIGLPDNEAKGSYPGVFDYRFQVLDAEEGHRIHYWAMLLWDRVIITVVFHDPACCCEVCTSGGSDSKVE